MKIENKKLFLAVHFLVYFITITVFFLTIAKSEQDKINDFKSAYESAKDKTQERIKALDHLEGLDHPKLIQWLVKEVIPNEYKKDDPLVVDRIIELIRKIKNEETIAELVKSAEAKPLEIKLVLIRGMTEINHSETKKLLIKFVNDKPPALRIAAMDTLSFFVPPEALLSVLQALEAKEWQVRASAINYLSLVRDESVRETVITALKTRQAKESGRLKHDISEAISMICQTDAPSGDNATVSMFYGIPMYSKNLVFVVDTSGSMVAAETGTPRIEILRKELSQAVQSLAPDVKFNMIKFNNDATGWQPTQGSGKQYQPQSLTWIKEKVETLVPGKPIGNTNLYSGLELAFQMADPPDKPKLVPDGKINTKEGIDTIFVMSDGHPDVGTYHEMDQILKVIQSVNQTAQLKIHTISVGIPEELAEAAFLKNLAEQNHGMYLKK